MATATRVPAGDGGTLEWTPKGGGSHYVEVDETVDGNDASTTEVTESNYKSILTDLFTIAALPADFDSANSIQSRIAWKQAGWVDDINGLTIRFQAGSDFAIRSVTGFHDTTYSIYESAADTGIAAKTKTEIEAGVINIAGQLTASGMSDGIVLYVTAVEVVLDYNTTTNTEGGEHPITEQPMRRPLMVLAH